MVNTKKKIVTHGSYFHTDDVFAVATMFLLLGEDNCEVIRSRDQSIIDSGDYVLDVGMVYDLDKKRFDHHQPGGAGKRDNGIQYSSFGLIWKHHGVDVCGSEEIAGYIDEKLIRSIDAYDNGQEVYQLEKVDVRPYVINDIIRTFHPVKKEKKRFDEQFYKAVTFAKRILEREIIRRKEKLEDIKRVQEKYTQTIDKRLIIFNRDFNQRHPWTALVQYPEPLFIVHPRSADPVGERWSIRTIQDNLPLSFKMRKGLPKTWRGKCDDNLAKITGVPDAVFCHRSGFMCVAKSKEGAIKLAEIALKQ